MKKSTKLITTAIALALVVAAMVVGIYAATSGSANISASVSWEATAGIQFRFEGYTVGSKEHQDYLTSQGKTFADFDALDQFNFHGGTVGVTNPQNIATVNTATTNQTASGISGTLNATFVDTSDDGVNNPRDIYYVYNIYNIDYLSSEAHLGPRTTLSATFTKLPESNSDVEVTYWANTVAGEQNCKPSDWETNSKTTPPTSISMDKGSLVTAQGCLIIRLRLKNPDSNLTNYNANVQISFTKGV